MKTTLITIVFTLTTFFCLGQTVMIPDFNDRYSEYVKALESGELDIDYQDFRFSFIESEQFNLLSKKINDFNDLKKEVYVQMKKSSYEEIVKLTKQMLSIDYTSMFAHKVLRQTYKIIGDTVNAVKYKAIQFGLLNSIVKKGNGQSCATSWPVIQIEEEYFILEMIGAKLQKQSVDNDGGHCDKMEVKVDGITKIYYFETSKVFDGYKKLGLK